MGYSQEHFVILKKERKWVQIEVEADQNTKEKWLPKTGECSDLIKSDSSHLNIFIFKY